MKHLLILLSFIIFSSTIFATEKRELVLELLKVTKSQENHEKMIQAYINNFSKNPQTNSEEFKNYFRTSISWDSLYEPTIKIYSESYSVEELMAITQFYKSPIGQSFVKKAPEVNKKTAAVIMGSIRKAMAQLQIKK